MQFTRYIITALKEFSKNAMSIYFILLKLKNKTYKSQVSIEGCANVCDFRVAIKNKFCDSYTPVQLSLFQPDGTTEIDPG